MNNSTSDESIRQLATILEREQKARADLLKAFPAGKAAIEARRRLIVAVEKKLKRPLTKLERSSFSRYPLTPALFFEQKFLICPLDQVEEELHDTVARLGKIRIIEALGRSKSDLQGDFERLLDIIEAGAIKAVSCVKIATEAKAFADWIFGVLKRNPLPSETKVVYIQLTENDNGFRVSLCGARSSGALSGKCNWSPSADYHITAKKLKLLKALDAPGTEPWWVILALVIIQARDFFRTTGAEFLKKIKRSDVRVTIGFPDGDLYKIKVG